MTTTPKSDSSLNHPELNHLLCRSPHDNRSLRDDRLHHQLHLLNFPGKRHYPVYIAIIVDNDIKVTIQNNIFYLLDLEEHLLQLQHGDHRLHQRDDHHIRLSDPHKWYLIMNITICSTMSSWHLQHDDQQLRHRHQYDLRYGHHSFCPPSTDHSTKMTALFSTETAKQEL